VNGCEQEKGEKNLAPYFVLRHLNIIYHHFTRPTQMILDFGWDGLWMCFEGPQKFHGH